MDTPILLIEDTPSLAMVYKSVLEKAGHEVVDVSTIAEARQVFPKHQFKIVLLDLLLPDGNGMELMAELIQHTPDVKIIVITANGSINRAVEAMRLGSFDFLVKPFDELRLKTAVSNAIFDIGHVNDTAPEAEDQLEGFIGSSEPMRNIYGMVRNIGRSTATVFITGESGTGKELCAQAIHDNSARAKGPFIPINCGAIPRNLLESEVFGHLKGSFSGAISDKKGAAATAHRGTLFLDEICEMDLALQTKLLRFLQTSTIQPVGANKPHSVDVRIICATNRDPMQEVRAGRFREDLYYRLHVVPIHMPALRERKSDIVEIANEMLRRFTSEENKNFTKFDNAVLDIFRTFDWPGNVRQLMNAIQNIVVLNDGDIVTPNMLSAEMQNFSNRETSSGKWSASSSGVIAERPTDISAFIGTPLAKMERDFIEATIEYCDGSIPQAAKLLDISPSTLYRKKEVWDRKN